MPKKGYRQSARHIEKRQERARETFMARGADQFFKFVLMLDAEDRRELVAERIADAEQIIAEAERILAGRNIRNSADPIEQFRKELLRNVKELLALRGDEMTTFDAASKPFVSETQTRHIPMTGTHTHDHSSFGHHDHDDGLHSHAHTHEADADHDHADQHDFGELRPGRVPQEGERVPVRDISGNYGRQLGVIGPVERRRLKNQQLTDHEMHRGG